MAHPQQILVDEFQKRKKRNPHLSLRAFAKWLKISPAQLSQMMAGKRPITVKSMTKISERLALSPVEKKAALSSLLQAAGPGASVSEKKLLHLQEDKFQLIADWHHLAILSLTRIKGAKADPRWIARRLGIDVETAHQALLRLERLEIVRLKPRFEQIGDPFEVASKTPSEAIRKYHRQNLNLAIEKIDVVPVHLRQFQSVSIALDPQSLELYQKLIDDFLEQALGQSRAQEGTEVYHLNVQLFPVTQTKDSAQ